MDEVVFHVSQTLEALQVQLYSGVQHGRIVMQNYSEQLRELAAEMWTGQRGIQLQDSVERLWEWIKELTIEFRRSVNVLQPHYLYSQFIQVMGNEAYRVGISYGCVGFVMGGVFGITIGLLWQQPPLPTQRMKGVVCASYRGTDAVVMLDDIPAPMISASDEVLIQVKAASVDQIDIKICSGYGRALQKQLNKCGGVLPVVLGRDCAGIVVEVGQRVSRVDVGDEVWLAMPYFSPGTMAELIVVRESSVAKKPRAVGFEDAASLAYAGCVAWDAMVTRAGLGPKTCSGRRILVHCGSTPVGCILLQLGYLWGAHVTTTCSLQAVPVVQALGAHTVVVFGQTDVEKALATLDEFDVVFNTAGPAEHTACQKFCRPRGLVVTSWATHAAGVSSSGLLLGSLYALWLRGRCLVQSLFGASTWGEVNLSPVVLDQLAALIENGSLQPVVDKIYSPHDAELAFQHCDSEETIGKSIVRFRSRQLLKKMLSEDRKRSSNRSTSM